MTTGTHATWDEVYITSRQMGKYGFSPEEAMKTINAELEELENYANGTVYAVLMERTGQDNELTGNIHPSRGNTASTTNFSTRPSAAWTSARTSGAVRRPGRLGMAVTPRKRPGYGPDAGGSHTPRRGRAKKDAPASPRFADQLREEESNSQQPAPPEGRSRESSDQ